MSIILKALALLVFAGPAMGVEVQPIVVIAMGMITGAFFVRGITCELASVYLWK
jgi:uncharacterized membrane protein YeiH